VVDKNQIHRNVAKYVKFCLINRVAGRCDLQV
jgi:hypothetical protein